MQRGKKTAPRVAGVGHHVGSNSGLQGQEADHRPLAERSAKILWCLEAMTDGRLSGT